MNRVRLDITDYVERLINVNKISSKYEYERKFKNPKEDATKELREILHNKIEQWEYELRLDLDKRNKVLGAKKAKDLKKSKTSLYQTFEKRTIFN